MMQIKDFTKVGSYEDIKNNLLKVEKESEELMKYLRLNLERTERNLVYFNILRKVASLAKGMICFDTVPIEVLGFFARTCFELNLRTRHVIKSDTNLNQFIYELASDELDIYKGIKMMVNEETSPSDIATIDQHIQKIYQVVDRHNIVLKDPLSVHKMARDTNQKDEYDTVYRLFCKYSHPTSYSINKDPDAFECMEFLNILIIHAQRFLFDTLGRIANEIKVDASEELSS